MRTLVVVNSLMVSGPLTPIMSRISSVMTDSNLSSAIWLLLLNWGCRVGLRVV